MNENKTARTPADGEPTIKWDASAPLVLPLKREWVGLTDEEISEYAWMGPDAVLAIKEAQEILKERNT